MNALVFNDELQEVLNTSIKHLKSTQLQHETLCLYLETDLLLYCIKV